MNLHVKAYHNQKSPCSGANWYVLSNIVNGLGMNVLWCKFLKYYIHYYNY